MLYFLETTCMHLKLVDETMWPRVMILWSSMPIIWINITRAKKNMKTKPRGSSSRYLYSSVIV
jgi:hypothetical protein